MDFWSKLNENLKKIASYLKNHCMQFFVFVVAHTKKKVLRSGSQGMEKGPYWTI